MAHIGIDLGTSNSAISYWKDGEPILIPNAFGERLTPSVVGVDDNGEIVVGAIAKERLISHPHLTASVFKRHLGTEKKYRFNSLDLTPEELSMFVIRSLKADAEAHLQEEIEEAVISVPAYFNDTQRKSTKRAAELAGLKVERLISEPTAAALAYGLHEVEGEANFLVFDLGGGTYDVSILEFFDGVMEVRSIAGDNFLGGEDFTNMVVAYFLEKQKLDPATLSSQERSALVKQAEMVKRRLGKEKSADMVLETKDGSYSQPIDRQTFDKLIEPLIVRLRKPIDRAMRDASLTPRDLNAVVLIGGASRMPVIKSVISKMIGRLPFSEINPDEAVALGASVQAALKNRESDLKELILTDVCPYTLGIEVAKDMNGSYETGLFSPIIERNSPIPISRVDQFNTISDNQSDLRVEIYQGESRLVKNNVPLGSLAISVPPRPAGHESIDVRFTYDINGILEVECTSVSTGKKVRTVIENNPGSMTEEEIEAQLEKLRDLKIHPRDRSENRLLLARGERLYEEALGDQRRQISELISEFEAVLSGQDEDAVKKAAIHLKERLDRLERWQDYEW